MQNNLTDLDDTAVGDGSGDSSGGGSGSRGERSRRRRGSGDTADTSGTDSGTAAAFGGDGDGDGGDGDRRGGDGDGTGTGTRKRRKRQTVNELVGEVASGPVKGKASRGGRRTGPDLGTLIDSATVGLFGLVAVATAHEHWLKDREDIIPITGPLKAWVDQLPAKTLKRIEKNLAPILFTTGCAIVVGPDVFMEMRLRAEEKRLKLAVSQQSQSAFGGGLRVPTQESVTGGTNGAHQPAGSAGEWHRGVPAAPNLGVDYDV